MLARLSFRNAKRQAKDYAIYFVTIIISVALIFSFNSILFADDIANLSENMKGMDIAILLVSIIVVFTIGWLVHYTMKFIVEKRSKEFAIYEILGIEKKDISRMFFIENLVIGVVALLVGIGIGVLLYQFFASIIMNIFEQPYEIKIVLNSNAIILTIFYFLLILFFSIFKNKKRLKNTNVYDLLYIEKQNELKRVKKQKGNFVIFCISVIMMIGALGITNYTFEDVNRIDNNNSILLIAIILLFLGIYLFYISINHYFNKRYIENKKRKYSKDNLFLYRNITSKINTMSTTMAIISILLTIVLIGLNIGMLLNKMLQNEIDMSYSFDIQMSTMEADWEEYEKKIEEEIGIKQKHEYVLYQTEKIPLFKLLEGTSFEQAYQGEIDNVIKLSDYNILREMLGYSPIQLGREECIIHTIEGTKKYFEEGRKKQDTIEIENVPMKVKEIRTENMSQIGYNGYIYFIVVPEENEQIIQKLEKSLEENIKVTTFWEYPYHMVFMTKRPTTEADYQMIRKLMKPVTVSYYTTEEGKIELSDFDVNVGIRGKRLAEVKSFVTIISLLSFYVALIFIMAVGTILAIQQLSDGEKYKYRYELLKKLGVDEESKNKTVLKQLAIYFLLPIILPIILSTLIILNISNIFIMAISIGEMIGGMLSILAIFLGIYFIYFMVTYVQQQNNIG